MVRRCKNIKATKQKISKRKKCFVNDGVDDYFAERTILMNKRFYWTNNFAEQLINKRNRRKLNEKAAIKQLQIFNERLKELTKWVVNQRWTNKVLGTLVPKLTLGPFLTMSVRNVKNYFVILAPPFNSHLFLCVPPRPLLDGFLYVYELYPLQ